MENEKDEKRGAVPAELMDKVTPMMQQYLRIKQQDPDPVLFFRLGDFYEMFFDDAKLASRELELTLTGKDCGLPERAPMCGVPFHSYEAYAARLVAKGYKVAICEQTEDPAQAKGLVDRSVIRVLTPGTVIEGSMLDESRNNYLCTMAAAPDGLACGLCSPSSSSGCTGRSRSARRRNGRRMRPPPAWTSSITPRRTNWGCHRIRWRCVRWAVRCAI